MLQYQNLVRTVLENGTRKKNRTGVDTISTFGLHYSHDMHDGFPLLTTKKISWKNIVVENLWFLSGEPHIGLLRKHGCHFWDPWADEKGMVPSAYGNFWRRFPVHIPRQDMTVAFTPVETSAVGFNDQILWAVNELRRNPMSRRVVVTAWAPGNAQTSKLPPCHVTFVLNVQNMPDPHLCLHLTQRSCDIALGVPYNLAGYAFLLCLMAQLVGLPAGIFSHTLVDAHIYTAKPDGSMAEFDHVPGLRRQLDRKARVLPRLHIDSRICELEHVHRLMKADTAQVLDAFQLSGYDPAPAIPFKVAV